jgi:TolB-like protein
MPSLVPGFEYDIFVSCRQKDNKYDNWVTEFVQNLKRELESTFKEEISVYFNISPHDADGSLKEKLKCLVFIPVISLTYCDPKSFVWENEFKAFIRQASEDMFGLNVKLPSGRFVNRILPVRIHQLDETDNKLFEQAAGEAIRGIYFIYREPGVNRPLTTEDDEEKNLEGISYRNQINKVANAIKEIIDGVRNTEKTGIKKTEESISRRPAPQRRNATGIIAAVLITLALVTAGYLIISRLKEQPEKSIAVLPFYNDSPDAENTYFINGVMDEILNNLQKIKDFKTISRTSAEQFRDRNRPPVTKIAKDLNVNYIVEGSGQKYGNRFILRVQLIGVKKNREYHLWAESYEQDILDAKDIIGIQNRVAQSIAAELKATLTPEEKKLMGKMPDINLNAYDLYMKAEDYHKDFQRTHNLDSYQRSVSCYLAAIEIDSSFAKAYSGLAFTFGERAYWESFFQKSFLDSCYKLVSIALSLDDQLEEGYFLKGMYHWANGHIDEALNNFDKALSINPNYYNAYLYKGRTLTLLLHDYIRGIENYNEALLLIRGEERSSLLRVIGNAYRDVGFIDNAREYYQEAFAIDSNEALNFNNLAWIEFSLGNFEEALKLAKQADAIDSINLSDLMFYSVPPGHDEEALMQAEKLVRMFNRSGTLNIVQSHRIGYAFYQTGKTDEAKYYLNQQIKYSGESIKLSRDNAQRKAAQYDLAATYAFLGDKEKAYQYLNEFDKTDFYQLWWVSLARHDPLFAPVRNEEQFQRIVKNMEAKYQKVHDNVGKWMEEQGIL